MLVQHSSCRAILITSPLEHHTALQTRSCSRIDAPGCQQAHELLLQAASSPKNGKMHHPKSYLAVILNYIYTHPVARKAFKRQPSASQGCPCQHIWIPDVLQPVKSSPQKGSQPTARSTTETSWQLCTWAKQKRGRRGSACSYPPTKLPSFRRQPFSKPLEPTGHGYLAKLHIKMSHGHSLNHFSKLGRRK